MVLFDITPFLLLDPKVAGGLIQAASRPRPILAITARTANRERFVKFLQPGSNPGDPGIKSFPDCKVG
jgi:hypothetical protein